nr:hypothetical protein CFP56_54954 [Quercus suber]
MCAGSEPSAPKDMPPVVECQRLYTAVAEHQYVRDDNSCIKPQQMQMLDCIVGTYINPVQLTGTDESALEGLRISFARYRKSVRGNTKGALSRHSSEKKASSVLTSMQLPRWPAKDPSKGSKITA